MTIIFTDEERKYLITEMFNWHVSEDCPDDIRKSIEKKLAAMKKTHEEAKK